MSLTTTRKLTLIIALGLGLLAAAGTLALLAAAAGAAAGAWAGGHTVCPAGPPDCDFSTPQEAVDAAAPGDELRVAAGVYTGVSARGGVTQALYLSKTVTIRGGYTLTDWLTADPLAHPTTLDAGGAGRVLVVVGPVSPTISGLRLTGGEAAGMGGFVQPWNGETRDAGGGAYVLSATVTLSGNWVLSNSAECGGGLFVHSGAAQLADNAVLSNTGRLGGGLFVRGGENVVLQGNLFSGNVVSDDGFFEGGGGLFLSDSGATLAGNTICSNTAGQRGGGLFLSSSRATLTGNTICSNTAGSYGGGLYLSDSPADLTGNTVRDNTAGGYGGGLSLRWSDATIHGNAILSNTAEGGGGLETGWSNLTLTDNTVAYNQATVECGGGLHLADGHGVIRDNLFLANTANFNGGGLGLCQATGELSGNRVLDNAAGDFGGGVFFSGSQATLDGETILDNTAGAGGGLGVREDGWATLVNTLIAGNRATLTGGGAYVETGRLDGWHTTLADNGAEGICVITHAGLGSAALLTNTVLVSHTIGITVGHETYAQLVGTLWWANGSDWAGSGMSSTSTSLWGNPSFRDPAGGDYHLGPTSAAIDVALSSSVTADLDGQPRPHYAGPDLGADEFVPLEGVKRVEPAVSEPGGMVTYTLTLSNTAGVPLAAQLTDTLPAEIAFLGPLSWSGGGTAGQAGGVITWSGTVSTATPVLIRWAALVRPEASYSQTIPNTAVVRDPYGIFWTRPALLTIPPRQLFLPCLLRQG